jgi:hypothetical protein
LSCTRRHEVPPSSSQRARGPGTASLFKCNSSAPPLTHTVRVPRLTSELNGGQGQKARENRIMESKANIDQEQSIVEQGFTGTENAASGKPVSEVTLQATPYRRSKQFGGTGGAPFSDDLTEICRLTQVTVSHGLYVDAIQCVWELPDGRLLTGQRHGGKGGNPFTFELAKGEYLNRVELRSSGDGIYSLAFYTTAGHKYGPFGGSGGSPHEIVAGPITGFFGRCGAGIDAFGVFSPMKCP